MKTIYIITAVHNRFEITKKFIMTLNKQTYNNIHLILVDDGSTDGTAEMVKKEFINSTIIQGDGNLWWGGALHKAYKYICKNIEDNESFVMLANDDSSFENDYVEKAINLLNENKNTLITGCGYSIHTNEQIDGCVYHSFKDGTGSLLSPDSTSNCASTRSLFFRVGDFKKIGGFHPILLPHYASDFEFTIRAYKKGYSIKSFSELKYYFDEYTTGDNDLKTLSIKQLFSKKSNRNPIYRLSFILLSTPIKYLPGHMLAQLKRYTARINDYRKNVNI